MIEVTATITLRLEENRLASWLPNVIQENLEKGEKLLSYEYTQQKEKGQRLFSYLDTNGKIWKRRG